MKLIDTLYNTSKIKQPSIFKNEAYQYFIANGFPTSKNEEYKYLNPASIIDKLGTPIKNEHSEFNTPFTEQANVFFKQGKYSISDVNTDGLIIATFDSIPQEYKSLFDTHLGLLSQKEADSFSALNSLAFENGLFIYLPKGSHYKETIVIQHDLATSDYFVFPRILLIAEEGSSINIVQEYLGRTESNVLSNIINEYFINSKADVKITQIHQTNDGIATHLSNFAVLLEDSRFEIINFFLDGIWFRHNLNIQLNGAGAHAELLGLYTPKKKEIVDNHTLVSHNVPNCTSSENYKGILKGGIAIFNGKIFVAKDAQKTNAYQSNKNILLSKDATINAKPQLEIYADDVKCSHGSSTGVIDPDMLFYMQARGIAKPLAQKLLLRSIISEIVLPINNEKIAEKIYNNIESVDFN